MRSWATKRPPSSFLKGKDYNEGLAENFAKGV